MTYFIEANDLASENKELLAKHNFYICSILIKRACSSNLAQKNTEGQLSYFKLLFKHCMKIHKEKMKNLKNSLDKFMLTSFHIDFIKTCVYYSTCLIEKHELKLKPLKLCKQIIELLTSLNDNFKFETNYYNQLKLDKISDLNEPREEEDEYQLGDTEKLKLSLIRTVSLAARKLNINDFGLLLDHLELVLTSDESLGSTQNLIRFAELIRYMCCEIELNEDLKANLSVFIQKVHSKFFISTFSSVLFKFFLK
jgi:hypothetical protein